MMGAASTALSDFLGRPVNISTPQSFSMDDLEKIKKERFQSETGMLVAVHFILEIEGILKSEFVNIMSVELARELLAGFGMGIQDAGESGGERDSGGTARTAGESSSGTGGKLSQEEIERLMGGGISTPAPEPAAAPSSGGKLSQEESERPMGSMSTAPARRSPRPSRPRPIRPPPPAGLSAACVSAPGAGTAGH